MKSCHRSLHDLVQILMRRSCDLVKGWLTSSKRSLQDPVKVPVRRSPDQIPPKRSFAWKSCRGHVLDVLVWKLFWDALGGFLYQDLVRSSPAAGPFMKILWASLRKILVTVFYISFRRSSGDPSDMLSQAFAWSCTGPCEKLWTRNWKIF